MDDPIAGLLGLLQASGYTFDQVMERIGVSGQDGLARNSTVPAEVSLAGAVDAQALLIRCFLLQQPVPYAAALRALDVALLEAAGVARSKGDQLIALVDVRPYASPDDGADGFVVSDLMPGLDGVVSPTRPDYVLGASPASMTLVQLVSRKPVRRALDLGTGCGVQALHLARHCEEVVATDLNPRALELARLTARLSGIEADFRLGSLYEPVAGERFDLIVSNPPYVMSPPGGDRLTYREGVLAADGLVEAVVSQAARHLNPGGTAQLLVNWAVVDGQPWEERLLGWVEGTGLDCLVIERERLDKFAYVELWLTDAGLLGSAGWRPAYDRWLAYFDELGIEEVGMGWIHLSAAGRRDPVLRFESWPHAVAQPIGDMFARDAAAIDASLLSTSALLSSRPRLVDVEQETFGEPGAADPRHIVLRQRRGLLRAIRVGTAEAAVLGALDGSLTLAQVLRAVAELLVADQGTLAAEILPLVRQSLRDQLLELA